MDCKACGASTDARSRIITYSYEATDKLLHHTVTETCRRCGEVQVTCRGEGLIGACKDCQYKELSRNNEVGVEG